MYTSGGDILGLQYNADERIQIAGRVPIPSVMDYQIDCMAIQYMHRQMELAIHRLSNIVFKKYNIHHWYEFYLSAFLLLYSLETIHHRQVEILARFKDHVRCVQTESKNFPVLRAKCKKK